MTKQEFLSQIVTLRKDIKSEERLIKTYRELADSPSSPTYENIGGGKQQRTDPFFVKLIILIDEKERELELERQRLSELQTIAVVAINDMENESYRTIISLRYLQGASWNSIAHQLDVSARTVYRWHKEALEQIKLPNL